MNAVYHVTHLFKCQLVIPLFFLVPLAWYDFQPIKDSQVGDCSLGRDHV